MRVRYCNKVLEIDEIPKIEGYIVDKDKIKKPINNPTIWLREAVVGYIRGDEIHVFRTNYDEEYLKKLLSKAKLKNE